MAKMGRNKMKGGKTKVAPTVKVTPGSHKSANAGFKAPGMKKSGRMA